jgi:type IV pilus assembly protein PilC
MATVFTWEGKTRQGAVQKGELSANNKEEVFALLRRQNITPINVSAKPREIKLSFGAPKLVQCLDILGGQTENPSLSKTIVQVRTDVESGSTFAEALRKHPKAFDSLYVNMVAAGEAGGILDTILQRLAAYMEKFAKIKKQIKSAMVYPSVIMFVGASNFLKGWGGLSLLIGFVGIFIGIKQWRKTEKGLQITDALALRLPIVGDLIKKVSVAKFTRTLGTLLTSGVPILEGLLIVARTAGNKVVEDAIVTTRTSVSEGKTLAEPLSKAKVFPAMVTQMIAVGEATGALDSMLTKIADFYDDEVDGAVATLTSMLEPVLMIFLGTTVGFVIIAMYMPIFQMGAVAGG